MPVKAEVQDLTLSLFVASGRQASPAGYEDKAREMYRTWVRDAAYYRWLNRGRPFGDAMTDWLAAETDYRRYVDSDGDVFVPAQVRRQAVEVAAYLRSLDRRPDAPDPVADWCAAESLAVGPSA